MTIIKTHDFILRPWNSGDIESLVKYAGNKKISDNLTDAFPHPFTKKDAEDFIVRFTKDDPQKAFAIEINGEACGSIGVFPQTDIHRKNAETGYWLAEPYWGRGIMSSVVREIIKYGFATFDITRIFARPFGTNVASHRVLEKAGMKLESRFEKTVFKNGQYHDELFYAALKA
jgi:[ribosomal protein S5]-alanine N-acetyltransferase